MELENLYGQPTKRVTLTVGMRTLRLWERAAKREFRWKIQDWIADACNRKAEDLMAQIEREERQDAKASKGKAAGPARVAPKGGRR